jgi:hypothetical protein
MMVHGLPFAVHCSPLGFGCFNPGTANGELRTVNSEPNEFQASLYGYNR